MNNITLISTNHSESGRCNSAELFKIIESLRPEVIFEEMPSKLHSLVYSDSFPALPDDAPLELKCVKNYLQKYDVKNIPVDIDVNQDFYAREVEYMCASFSKYAAYKKIEDDGVFICNER